MIAGYVYNTVSIIKDKVKGTRKVRLILTKTC